MKYDIYCTIIKSDIDIRYVMYVMHPLYSKHVSIMMLLASFWWLVSYCFTEIALANAVIHTTYVAGVYSKVTTVSHEPSGNRTHYSGVASDMCVLSKPHSTACHAYSLSGARSHQAAHYYSTPVTIVKRTSASSDSPGLHHLPDYLPYICHFVWFFP